MQKEIIYLNTGVLCFKNNLKVTFRQVNNIDSYTYHHNVVLTTMRHAITWNNHRQTMIPVIHRQQISKQSIRFILIEIFYVGAQLQHVQGKTVTFSVVLCPWSRPPQAASWVVWLNQNATVCLRENVSYNNIHCMYREVIFCYQRNFVSADLY